MQGPFSGVRVRRDTRFQGLLPERKAMHTAYSIQHTAYSIQMVEHRAEGIHYYSSGTKQHAPCTMHTMGGNRVDHTVRC